VTARASFWLVLAPLAFGAPALAQTIKLPAKLPDLEKRAKADSDDAAAQYNVALGYWNAKRWDDADSALRRATRIDPQFAPAYLALGRLVFARRLQLWDDMNRGDVPAEWKPKLDEGFRLWRRAFIIDPLVDLRIEAAARPGKSAWWIQSEYTEQLYDYLFGGFDDLQEGNYDGAYNRLNRLYDETQPQEVREGLPSFVFYYRGLAAAHIGHYREAIADFQRLINRLGGKPSADSLVYYIPTQLNEYRYMIAVLTEKNGDTNDAIDLYHQLLTEDASFYMAHARLAGIYESHNMIAQAISERQAAINANPDDASLLYELGLTYAKTGQWPLAEQQLKAAMAANPHDARVPYYLGIVEQQQKNAAGARDAFTKFIAMAPSRYERQIADAKQRMSTLQ
jgi:tetratricopeptide (TPR) repeat protein